MRPKVCPRCGLTGGSRDDGFHIVCRVLAEADEERKAKAALLDVLRTIAEGCGHERCHAFPWIRAARAALKTYGGGND